MKRLLTMTRRDFIGGSTSAGVLAGGSAGWPGAARAQQPDLPVIGFLDGVWGHLNGMVGGGLGKNGIRFKADFGRRYGHQPDQMVRGAADLVKRQVAAILAFSTQSALAAKAATSVTPIIFLADD